MPESDCHWLERYRAVGKAQSRYLWALLVAVVFYGAIHPSPESPENTATIQVPMINLELNASVVLASGVPVLSFLVLAIIGSLRAYDTAREKLGLSQGADWSGEELDVHPNAIDLAFYTTPKSPKLIASATYFIYPLFLLLGLSEAAWIAVGILAEQLPGWGLSMVIGAVLWVPALWQVLSMFFQRIGNARKLWATR